MYVPTSDSTPWTLLSQQAAENASSPFLVDADGTISRAEMAERVTRLASGLWQAGVQVGDRVVIQANNRREHMDLLFALNALGAVYCPLHPEYVGGSLQHALDLLEPKLVVVDDEHRPNIAALSTGRLVELPTGNFSDDMELAYEDLFDKEMLALPDVDPAAPALILMTSGTTGPAKGVVISSQFALSVGVVNARTRHVTENDRLFSCYSFCHTNPHCFTLFPALVAHASMAWSARFSTSRFWQEVRELGATQFSLFTTTMQMLLETPRSQYDRAHSATTCVSIGTPPGRGLEFEKRFGVRIAEPYGMTECGAMTVSAGRNRRIGSSGPPVDEWTVRIMNTRGDILPAGSTGEIVGRPNRAGMVMSGYFRDERATSFAFRDLWFHTGDLGRFDDDGYLWYVGRSGETIRRRGENISAWDVEQAARRSPLVADAAAVGVPSPWGEDDVLLIVERRTPAADVRKVLKLLTTELPRHAVPRHIRVVDELPRTVTGRIMKKALAETGVTADTWTVPETTRRNSDGKTT